MKVKFKKLRENAKLPVKSNESDFGYDVYACDCIEVLPGVYKYPLGFALQIDETERVFLKEAVKDQYYEKTKCTVQIPSECILDIDFRPRSSIYKTGMSLCNSEGTVDRDYTGEVCLFFYHLKPELPKYEIGERIAQMKIGFTLPIEFVEVEELEETERGDGGFGSTGKN